MIAMIRAVRIGPIEGICRSSLAAGCSDSLLKFPPYSLAQSRLGIELHVVKFRTTAYSGF